MPVETLAQGAGATAESEETTQQQADTQSRNEQQQPRRTVGEGETSVLDAVLRDMELPADVLEDLNKRRKPAAPAQEEETLADRRRSQIAEVTGQEQEPNAQDETAGEPQEAVATEEIQTPEEEQQPADEPQEAVAEGEEAAALFDSDAPLGEEWTPEQRAQILDGRKKLRTRTADLTALTEKAAELLDRARTAEARLQAGPPRQIAPTFSDPLPEVMNPEQLANAEDTWEEALDWAEEHEEGAEAGVDKGPQGEELTKNYTPEEVRKVKQTAKRILRRAVPQKREWIQQAAGFAQQAMASYPELFKDTPESAAAAAILTDVPELKRRPDFLLLLGQGVTGRKPKGQQPAGAQTNGANGKPLSKAAQTILNAPKLSPAPGATRTRSPAEAGRASENRVERTKTARTDLLKSQLTDKDLEAFIRDKLAGRQGKGGRAAVLA